MSVIYTTPHGNTGCLTHWARPGIEPSTSWFLVGFISAVPKWELPVSFFFFFFSHVGSIFSPVENGLCLYEIVIEVTLDWSCSYHMRGQQSKILLLASYLMELRLIESPRIKLGLEPFIQSLLVIYCFSAKSWHHICGPQGCLDYIPSVAQSLHLLTSFQCCFYQELKKTKKAPEFTWWLSELMIWCCDYSSLWHCCGSGLIPDPGTSTYCGCGKRKRKGKEKRL